MKFLKTIIAILLLVVVGATCLFLIPEFTKHENNLPIIDESNTDQNVDLNVEEVSAPGLTKIYDHVYDVGTYDTLNYEYAKGFYHDRNDNWGGGCSAVSKVTNDGTMLVGRNMDLNISNKNAYVFRTKVDGCHETINLAYTFRDYSPDDADVITNGLSAEFRDLLPFIADDVLNDAGLYIEVNMRHGEFNDDGTSKFACSGTNPNSTERIHTFMLPRYIGEHCATVAEALEYVQTLDLYTQDGYWNYCFIIADPSGRHGVLEIAQNQLYWNENAPAHANFYITPELNQIEDFKTGLGRYETLLAGIDNVNSEEDMLNLMKSVNYFQFYSPYECKFDIVSEYTGELIPLEIIWDESLLDYFNGADTKGLTTEQATNPNVRNFIYEISEVLGKYIHELTRQEQQDANEYWETIFTEVVNCNNRTLFVRFYEDDSKTLTLTFDN